MVAARSPKKSDRNLLLVLAGGMLVLLIGVSLLARTSEDNDPRPSVENAGASGAKAAFVALRELGVSVNRWDQPFEGLRSVQAENTTLLVLEPKLAIDSRNKEAAELKNFMERGGRVLLAGSRWASLLPDGDVQAPGTFAPKLCYSKPEGPGQLAQAGEVEMRFDGGWKAKGPQFRVEQTCMGQPIVVRVPVGKGEAIWWSSPTPISNSGLRVANNLKLVLASLGNGRQVLFDEWVQTPHGSNEHLLRGLPLWWLLAQFVLLFVLLVFSFSRRKGPLRMPGEMPRSSPVEFANSMGDLYEKAGATGAATEAAKRSLLRMLQREAGVGVGAINDGPDAVADSLQLRFGGEWTSVADHLRQATAVNMEPLNAKSALILVKAMRADEARVRGALQPAMTMDRKAEGDVGSESLAGAGKEWNVRVD